MADLAYILSSSGNLNEALDLARTAVEKFYIHGNASSGTSSLQSVQSGSLAARAAENALIDLSGKTVPELIELLSHRDIGLKQRACDLIKKKAVDSKDAKDLSLREQVKELLIVPTVIQTLFTCATIESHPQLQLDAMSVISGILTEQVKDRIRQVGSIDALCSLWKRGTEETLLNKILTLTLELMKDNLLNAAACKQTKRIPELCAMLAPEANISLPNRTLLIGILRWLSKVPKNRDHMSKTGVAVHMLQLVTQLWKTPISKNAVVPGKDAMLTQQLLETLANLALGPVLKASVKPTDFQMLTSLMDGKKVIKKDWMISPQPDQEFFIMTCIQSQLLQLLAHLATTDENRRTMGQLHAVQLLLMYCLPGDHFLPADGMLYWVDMMDHLIQEEDNRALFLKYRGLTIALGLITSPKSVDYQQHRQLNHRTIELIISCVSHGPQDPETLNSVMQTLVIYCTQNSDDLNLQILALKVMHHLSNTETHCETLPLIPGLLDYVLRQTFENSTASIIEDGVAFLTNLGAVPHVKRSLNTKASTIIPGLLAYLGNDQLSIQIKITKLLASVFANDGTGAKVLVEREGTIWMLTLMGSPSADLQEQSLAVLDQLAVHYPEPEKLKHQYLASSVLPRMVDLLGSNTENVQGRAFSLLSRVVDHRACKLSLDSLGVGTKLEELKKHPNVKRDPNSTIANLIATIQPKFSGTMADLNAAVTMTEQNPEAATDALLSQCTKWQLMQLVKYALNQNCEGLMQLVDDTVQANIANPPPRKSKNTQAPAGPAVDESSVQTGLKPILMAPAPPPPSGAKKAPPPPPSSASTSSSSGSRGSVLDQITSLAKAGGIKLKKIDTQKEQEERKQRERSDPMASLFQGIKDSTSSNPEGTRLLEQGTTDGRQFWVKDPSKYVEEIEKSFSLDYNFMKILLYIIESTVSTIKFDKLISMSHKKDKPIEPKALADQLRNLGFTVKHNIVLLPNSETPVTQYTQIIVPGELPTHQICKTIIMTVAKSTPVFANVLPADAKAALSGSTAPGSEPFECRLCKKSFPGSQAIDVSGRPFCQPCSEVVLDALKKRAGSS